MKRDIGRIAVIILIALLSVYLIFAFFFNNHYFLNTTVNGVEFSGLKVKDIDNYFSKQVKEYTLNVTDINGHVESIKGTDIKLKYKKNSDAKKLMEKQNMFAWPISLFKKNNIDTIIGVSYDEDALLYEIDNLSTVKAEQVKSVSAYPKYNGTEFEIIPETQGTAIKKDILNKKITDAVTSLENNIILIDKGCYDMPVFTKDSHEVKEATDKMNNMLGAKITYKMKEDSVIDTELISKWIKCDKQMNVYIDEEAIKSWLTEFGDTYDTKGTTRTIVTPTGKSVKVSGGTYGWSINEIEELPLIVEHIKNRDIIEKEPIYYEKAASKGDQDWGNTYVEVDLNDQHMWYIKNGDVVLESDVVTGTPNSNRSTPQGVYTILEKAKDTTLVGSTDPNTGKPKYRTPVSYWMRVTWSGIGLHDATWQSSFGGDRYTYAGSHGCINMPLNKANELFNVVSVGTPVVIHN